MYILYIMCLIFNTFHSEKALWRASSKTAASGPYLWHSCACVVASTLHQGWSVWPVAHWEKICHSLLRLIIKRQFNFGLGVSLALTLSFVPCSGGSQLPCCMQPYGPGMEKGPCVVRNWSLACELGTNIPPRWAILQFPDLANSLTATLWETQVERKLAWSSKTTSAFLTLWNLD